MIIRPAMTMSFPVALKRKVRMGAADRAAQKEKHPNALWLSAHTLEDTSALFNTIITSFGAMMVEGMLVVPNSNDPLSARYMKARGSCRRSTTKLDARCMCVACRARSHDCGGVSRRI